MKPSHRPSVLVAHSGKQHAYRHALAAQNLGLLRRFVTSSYYKPSCFPDCLVTLSRRLDAMFQRRRLGGLDPARVTRGWRFELPELVARLVAANQPLVESLVMRRDATFDRWVARSWAAEADVYWGFQGSCLESLRAAKRGGALAVAEFATAHVTSAVELLSAEAERHPEWADSISNLRFPDWYRERMEQEPLEADYCVVASGFTQRSLNRVGVGDRRIKLLPLGADLSAFTPSERPAAGPFRILFVGGVGQRKGIKYLLEAYKKMRTSGTELVLVGPLVGTGKALHSYQGVCTHLGRLDQGEVIREMHKAHVLVLPSVFEGFGLVIPEAMATGLPVIASTHTAGPEIIRDGEEGFILSPDDVDGIADRLARLACDRTECAEMGRRAALRAHDFSWEAHTERLGQILNEIWQEKGSPVQVTTSASAG